jgi:hypothetical protein
LVERLETLSFLKDLQIWGEEIATKFIGKNLKIFMEKVVDNLLEKFRTNGLIDKCALLSLSNIAIYENVAIRI